MQSVCLRGLLAEPRAASCCPRCPGHWWPPGQRQPRPHQRPQHWLRWPAREEGEISPIAETAAVPAAEVVPAAEGVAAAEAAAVAEGLPAADLVTAAEAAAATEVAPAAEGSLDAENAVAAEETPAAEAVLDAEVAPAPEQEAAGHKVTEGGVAEPGEASMLEAGVEGSPVAPREPSQRIRLRAEARKTVLDAAVARKELSKTPQQSEAATSPSAAPQGSNFPRINT